MPNCMPSSLGVPFVPLRIGNFVPMSYLFATSDAVQIPLPDRSVDLVFGSPPYLDARTYGINAQRDCQAWIDWMLNVTIEACRVSKGLVLWVCAGVVRQYCYQPGPEGLLYKWWKRGGIAWRPAYWYRSGIPGSGGQHWLRADVEYVLAFLGPDRRPMHGRYNDTAFWTDNTAMGHPPKWELGGDPSNRSRNGARVNQVYIPPVLANPGNLIKTGNGFGALGNHHAHENEAPFPEALAEFFIKTACPPGGVCLDPFSGSGTAVAVADRLDRHGIGLDIRRSQAELGIIRITRPHLKRQRNHLSADVESYPLFD